MKTNVLTCLSILACALAGSAFGQDPAISPAPSATVAPIAGATASNTPAAAVSAKSGTDLEDRIDRKVQKGLHITIGDDDRHRDRVRDRDRNHDNDDDSSWLAVPIVGIIFSTLFGTPVLIVAAIMFFSYLRSRSLHRTVRNMVEKGQPVPAALFAQPPVIRARSDMRRGVVLVMIGIGLMVFFGAVNDWEGGSWALGIIPFLIGAGYLLVWKLEGNGRNGVNTGTDNFPPVP